MRRKIADVLLKGDTQKHDCKIADDNNSGEEGQCEKKSYKW